MVRRRLLVHGIVQGVGFRVSCARQAQRLGVTGWVRNTADGEVEIAIEGSPDAVDAFTSWSRRGPSGAWVDRVDVSEEEPRGESGFGIRR